MLSPSDSDSILDPSMPLSKLLGHPLALSRAFFQLDPIAGFHCGCTVDARALQCRLQVLLGREALDGGYKNTDRQLPCRLPVGQKLQSKQGAFQLENVPSMTLDGRTGLLGLSASICGLRCVCR